MDLQDFIQETALGAGEIIRAKHHKTKTSHAKTSRGDIVTEVDLETESYIISRIKAEFPGDAILSEESGWDGIDDGRRVWILDPVDGTLNYALGVPFFCTSIGLATGGRPIAGAIYDPIHDEMFFAKSGEGAYLNGKPISVSAETHLDDGVVSVSWVHAKADSQAHIGVMEDLSGVTSYFRRFGSAALALSYVACGRIHAMLHGGLNPWDVAAATVILEEAGACVTNFHNSPLDMRSSSVDVVAGNIHFHTLMLNAMQRRMGLTPVEDTTHLT